MKLFSLSLTRASLILLVSFFIILIDNVALMRALLGSYPLTPGNIAFLVSLREKADHEFSHDHLFHTLLGSMEVETSVYDKHHDILAGEWNP